MHHFTFFRIRVAFFLFLLACAVSSRGIATEITVGFDSPTGDPIPLRLSQGSNGWTSPVWTEYFNDIGVEYRRMDHWNDGYSPVRRRPDGSLWFDSAFLDATIYDSTGGYSFKAYPTVDFCPMCLDTDFLQNPLQFARGSVTGWLTPAGTIVVSGQFRPPGTSTTSTPSGLYELDRKGVVISQKPYQQLLFVTPSNRVVVRTADGFSVLGPDRKEIFHGTGTPVQEFDGNSFLVASGGLNLVDLKGNVLQTFPGTFPGKVLLTKGGLFSFEGNELFLIDKAGKRSIQQFPPESMPPNQGYLASNPRDPDGRVFFGSDIKSSATSGYDRGIVYAFSSSGQLLWKSDLVPSDSVRGLVSTHDGVAVFCTASMIYSISQTGIIWKTSVGVRGALDAQLVSTPGLETVVMRTYEDEIDEYDTRTGEPLMRWGEESDQSPWACVPPKDLDGWQATTAYFLKHYNKDMGLGWDRWECWNEPNEHGFFWAGTWQDYAVTVEASMKAVQAVDPSIVMDVFDGGNWAPNVVGYANAHNVRLDAFSSHGYRADNGDYVAQEQKNFSDLAGAIAGYTGGKLQMSNTEWNVHPGQGEDLSDRPTTGVYRAPFQSEMVYLMGKAGVKFSAEFCMLSGMKWPAGWVYTYDKAVGGKAPPAGGQLIFVTPAYNAARLWAMLPQQAVPVTNDFAPQVVGGTASRVEAIASCNPDKGEYGMLVWNYSNNSTGAKDETVNLTFNFKNETTLHLRHFIIDQDHSYYGKDFDHQYLEAAETANDTARNFANKTVTMKKDSLHAFFFTRKPLKANPGKSITVEAHHPVPFDGSLSTGAPAFYRWDLDATDGVDFPEPGPGNPSKSHLFGVKPVLAHGYDKPGTYTVTLRVMEDGYNKPVDPKFEALFPAVATATTTVTVVPEKTAPDAPKNLATNCVKTDHQVYLEWDALNFARNPDVAGFNIYRKDGTGDWKKLAASTTAVSYVDSGVTEGMPYRYRVTAIDSSGNEGAPSNEATATFQLNKKAPKSPVNLQAVILSGTDIVKLDWDNDNLADAACVKGFNVYRRTAGSANWQKLTDVPTVYKRYYDEVSNVGMASKYEYCITALDFAKNESLQSDAVAAVPK